MHVGLQGGDVSARQPGYAVKQKNVLNSPHLRENRLKPCCCLRSQKLFDFKFNRRPLSTTTARNLPACDILSNKNYLYPHQIKINYSETLAVFRCDRSPVISVVISSLSIKSRGQRGALIPETEYVWVQL